MSVNDARTVALSGEMARAVSDLRLEDTLRVLSFGKRAETEVADVSRAVLAAVGRPGPENFLAQLARRGIFARMLGRPPQRAPATIRQAVSAAVDLDRHEFRLRVETESLRRLQARAEAANQVLDQHICAAIMRIAQADKVDIPAGASSSVIRGRDALARRVADMRLTHEVGRNSVLTIMAARERGLALITEITGALGRHDAAIAIFS